MEVKDDIRILVVDDIKSNLTVMREFIKKMGYTPYLAQSAKDAIKIIDHQMPHLILLDVSMPEISGFEFCEMLKKDVHTRQIPIIFISATEDKEDRTTGFELGAVDFVGKPFDYGEVAMRINTHLKIYCMQSELEENNRRLNLMVQKQAQTLWEEQRKIMLALSTLVEEKDEITKDHSGNVSYNSWLLAQAMQFSFDFEEEVTDAFVRTIESASVLHDIGKISIPDTILLKKSGLTEEEREIMKSHSELGRQILTGIYGSLEQNDFIKMAIDIAHCHHERWDGKGYPQGLKGEKIPLSARIVGVIDVYDALTNERCYKKAYSHEKSMEIIKEGAGTQFDPKIVEVMERIQAHLIN